MENSQELLTDNLQSETEVSQDQAPETMDGETAESTQKSPLDQLIERRTGVYSVKMDLADVKWVRNCCSKTSGNGGKFSFTGPNEAFMVMNCFLGFSAATARLEQQAREKMESDGTVQIQASAIEAAAILLNKFEGSGIDEAQRVFKVAMALNPIIMEFKQLDQIIDHMRKEEMAAQPQTEQPA